MEKQACTKWHSCWNQCLLRNGMPLWSQRAWHQQMFSTLIMCQTFGENMVCLQFHNAVLLKKYGECASILLFFFCQLTKPKKFIVVSPALKVIFTVVCHQPCLSSNVCGHLSWPLCLHWCNYQWQPLMEPEMEAVMMAKWRKRDGTKSSWCRHSANGDNNRGKNSDRCSNGNTEKSSLMHWDKAMLTQMWKRRHKDTATLMLMQLKTERASD